MKATTNPPIASPHQCPNCGAEMQTTIVPRYHYPDCGLTDVYFDNVAVTTCGCGRQYAALSPEQLDSIMARLKQQLVPLTQEQQGFLAWWEETRRTIPQTLHVETMIPFVPPPRRKDPCPCGSGREYRKCHEGQMYVLA